MCTQPNTHDDAPGVAGSQWNAIHSIVALTLGSTAYAYLGRSFLARVRYNGLDRVPSRSSRLQAPTNVGRTALNRRDTHPRARKNLLHNANGTRTEFLGDKVITMMRSAELSPLLCANDLCLDRWTRVLAGPSGAERVEPGAFVVLRELLQRPGQVVAKDKLIGAIWPDADREPECGETGLRKRVLQARQALERVGVPGERLELVFLIGYRFVAGGECVARILTPAEAAVIDQMRAAQLAKSAA